MTLCRLNEWRLRKKTGPCSTYFVNFQQLNGQIGHCRAGIGRLQEQHISRSDPDGM